MNFIKNIKIGGKMILGFGLVIALTIVLAVVAALSISDVNSDYENLMDGAVERSVNALQAQSEIRAIRRVTTASVMHAPRTDIDGRTSSLNALLAEMQGMHRNALEALDKYDQSTREEHDRIGHPDSWRDERLALSAAVRVSLNQYITVFNAVQAYAHAGNHAAALQAVTEAASIVTEIVANTGVMVDLAVNGMYDTRIVVTDEAYSMIVILIVVAAVIVLVAAIIAIFIARALSKPVTELVALTKQVASGQVNMNLDRSKITKDEVGMLTGDVYAMVDTIRGMVDDISKFSHEIDQKGDIEYRIDASKYPGSYGEMMDSLNVFTDNFVNEVQMLIGVLASVNKGDFNVSMNRLPGKKVVMNEAVEALATNLNAVNAEVSAMIDAAAVKGNLDFQIDASKYDGGWNSIMTGLNNIAKAVDAPVSEINAIMGNLSRGDFSTLVSGEYAGDFDQMKKAVNFTVETLASYIEEINKVLSQVSEGDLTANITREYVGNFVEIKNSINNIAHTLHNTMSEITAAAEQVMSGAEQISTSASDLAIGAQEQASSVEELNASIEVVSEQTRQNAENAGQANELSGKSAESAQEGNEAMSHMLSAMQTIKESTDSITGIIKTIDDIAFQTNLLALNASVEAARAGEHGRGFAVVAEEVRTLAGRSQTAAAETTGLIGESIQRTESGAAIAETTSESLNAIVQSVNDVLSIINDIANSSQEQAESVQHISDGLSQISKVVQSNSAVSEETAAASQELSSQAQLLQQLVSYFKL